MFGWTVLHVHVDGGDGAAGRELGGVVKADLVGFGFAGDYIDLPIVNLPLVVVVVEEVHGGAGMDAGGVCGGLLIVVAGHVAATGSVSLDLGKQRCFYS